jgi:hypothetical protein
VEDPDPPALPHHKLPDGVDEQLLRKGRLNRRGAGQEAAKRPGKVWLLHVRKRHSPETRDQITYKLMYEGKVKLVARP